ncbi:CPBP family intramembrane glutamic endopeptidase [Paenibacillus radicis (ex Gao et al. 2016)]|uniref:CAAX amino protease n=1 Tax=Paenibacillus radicis (ex Gao et al. 2016) TaxID=1737354 RepID=A0A917H751_9BACL|nr:type II CAAX endopeptidase family protein [Paenibacillus radicis (ex Gao et al. 2016)]GGG69773.1 CAAX amino protease [Paenibacillus radicis (ex Gao et al. 2016)]
MKKVLIMIGNIALYLGVFYALLYLLRSTYNYEATQNFAKFLDVNPAMFMVVLFTLITLVYLIIFRIKGWIWPQEDKNLFRAAGFRRLSASRVLLMIALGLAGSLFSIGLIVIDDIAKQFPSIPALVDDLIRGDSIWYVILGAGLIGPAFEEILFRGLIFRELRRVMPVYAALVLQAGAYAYFQPSAALSVISIGSGLIYGVLYLRTGSLWAPILVQNTAMSTIFLFKYIGFYEWFGRLGDIWLYIITALCLIALIGGSVYVWRTSGNGGIGEQANGSTKGGLTV